MFLKISGLSFSKEDNCSIKSLMIFEFLLFSEMDSFILETLPIKRIICYIFSTILIEIISLLFCNKLNLSAAEFIDELVLSILEFRSDTEFFIRVIVLLISDS